MLDRNTTNTLYAMFAPLKSLGRSLIPVGLCILKCTSVYWKYTKKGQSMLCIELWRKPLEVNGHKVSFNKLILRHVVGEGTGGNWYDNFTVGIHYDKLIHLQARLEKKPSFKAVIGRRQVNAKIGMYTSYWENYIDSVHPIADDVRLTNDDYLRLLSGDVNDIFSIKPDSYYNSPKISDNEKEMLNIPF